MGKHPRLHKETLGMRRDFVACRYCGAPGNAVCETCHKSIVKAKRPQSTGIVVNDEIRAEVKRRLARFESPTSIARALGLSHHQVNDIMHPNRKAKK